ncbi:sensor histidine kinase [Amycolatopsis jiangsuensis]|uniref:histidine kinase n=1 Tax=Amycolatopsis jiangsuensis TaxID=1181879 RepID=A0A840IVQ0_9PSEU|nr:HAMP domain-containing sensor histidine kinase [Amycolatopsis jiangsuensis]MBB4686821.1 signal transduction histidine kinase [Amycolatopsis jiangsuensis]
MSVRPVLRRSRLSIRLRLTLLYGGLVLVCGVALLATVYFLMRELPTYDLETAAGPVQATPATRLGELPLGVITTKEDILTVLAEASAVALLGLALVSFLIGWIIAGRILAPIHRIARTARTVASDTLHERINLDGRQDEFTELADTLDTMLDRLLAGFEARQRFAANASHELRTPLATIRTLLQVAVAHPDEHDLATLAPKLLATNDRSIATVEALLTLSRADHGLEDVEPVDLAEVAAGALAQVGAEAADHRIGVHSDLAPVRVEGDKDLLHQLVINLLHNAIRHNHPGGTARLTTVVRGDTAVVTVTNTGDPVPDQEAERLFEPFYRQLNRVHATGHGLGLTLVRAIAHSHRGTVAASPNSGGGLTVTATLPALAASAPRSPVVYADAGRRLLLPGSRA